MALLPSPFAPGGPWLFGARTDLAVFGGSALASLALLGVGALGGFLHTDSPEWVWWVCVLGIDVAHVWSTSFRVYLDPAEVRRRRMLYLGLPVLIYGLGVLVHAFDSRAFWTVLAYLAVFHFVRQQAGWVRLYHRRVTPSKLDRALDMATVYTATLYPLLWWHGHLPRHFHWFLEGDFVTLASATASEMLFPVYVGVGVVYALRQLVRATRRTMHVGPALVISTTWLCWALGILVFDSDYAFTVTNVVIHGVPYLALTYAYGKARASDTRRPAVPLVRVLRFGALGFFALILLLALFEETLWDRSMWHEREWAFGQTATLSGLALTFVVPLLALPQAVHYALDGFIWRREGNER